MRTFHCTDHYNEKFAYTFGTLYNFDDKARRVNKIVKIMMTSFMNAPLKEPLPIVVVDSKDGLWAERPDVTTLIVCKKNRL